MKTMKLVEDKKYGCEKVATGSFAQFAREQKLADPIRVPIRARGLTGSGDPNQCHTNALILAYRYGGGVLCGLAEESLFPYKFPFGIAVGHSVWITPEGNAVCPTAHNWDRGGDFELIPCWEHNYEAIRAFFESNIKFKHPTDIMFKKNGEYYAVDNVHDGIELGENLEKFPRNQRRAAIKLLTKERLAGSKSKPLRDSFIKNNNFYPPLDFDWFCKTQNKKFYETVLER